MLASLFGETALKKSMMDNYRTGAKKALLEWTKNAITRYVISLTPMLYGQLSLLCTHRHTS